MATTVQPIPPPFFSPYLDDQCNKINAKPVPWEVSIARVWVEYRLTLGRCAGLPKGKTSFSR